MQWVPQSSCDYQDVQTSERQVSHHSLRFHGDRLQHDDPRIFRELMHPSVGLRCSAANLAGLPCLMEPACKLTQSCYRPAGSSRRVLFLFRCRVVPLARSSGFSRRSSCCHGVCSRLAAIISMVWLNDSAQRGLAWSSPCPSCNVVYSVT